MIDTYSDPEFWQRELNPSQLEAVTYCDGPSLVIAGAGSGKTRVLTYKIAYLMQERHVSVYEIMALTFTNKAAREMNSRIAQIVGGDEVAHLWSGTFHSIFSRLLRRECEHIGFTSNFTIYDTSDSKSLIKQIIKELALDDKTYAANAVQNRISEAKNKLILPGAYAADASTLKQDQMNNMPALYQIYQRYWDRCHQANAMDFDDLLLYTFLLFRDHPDILKRYKQRYRYILVDEYQDTNFAQHVIIRQLTDPTSCICVVGDDAQSIYAFRGANINNILQFTEHYPTARTIKLERNYRSTQNIVEAANSIIAHNRRQIPKTVYSEKEKGSPLMLMTCYSDREEAAKVVGEIRRLNRYDHVEYNDIAVLYRVNSLSRSFEDEFRKTGVPYRIYGGLSFYQRKEIKDVLAYLRLCVNEHDEEAFRRVVNYPARGIGQTSMDKLQGCARAHGVSLWQVALDPDYYGLQIGRTVAKVKEFCALIASFKERIEDTSAFEFTRDVIQRSRIAADVYSDKDPEHLSKQENLDELLGSIKSMEQELLEQTGRNFLPLAEYLQQVSLATDSDKNEGEDESRVTLMTIHAAKGLEFNTVFLVGVEEDIFPGSQAMFPSQMEEERRLFYVAVTRAKERCYLSHARSRFRYGSVEFSEPSRFINDIGREYLRSADTTSAGPRPSATVVQRPRMSAGLNSNLKPETALHAAPAPRFTPKAAAVAKPSATSSPEIAGLNSGVRVSHNRFGEGTVRSIEGKGDSLSAVVEFDNVGSKKLLLKYAQLTILK